MALQKQPVPINFALGVDTKTDPKQISLGRFLELKNCNFSKAGLFQKRNGFASLPALPSGTYSYLTTYNGGLTALGTSLASYSTGAQQWVNKGTITATDITSAALVSNNANQQQCDVAISSTGLTCCVYTDVGTTTTYKYTIVDTATQQVVVAPTSISTANGTPRVFTLNNYFVIVFPSTAANTLQYIAITITAPATVTVATNLSTNYSNSGAQGAFDGIVANNVLYIAFAGNGGGGDLRVTSLSATLTQGGTTVFAVEPTTLVGIGADFTTGTPEIYVAKYNSAATTGKWAVLDNNLSIIRAPTQFEFLAVGQMTNITVTAANQLGKVFYETTGAFTYGTLAQTDAVNSRVIPRAGAVGGKVVIKLGCGLAAKAFRYNNTSYFVGTYGSNNQPTYFLIDENGNIGAKFAYQNGAGYLTKGLSSVSMIGSTAYFSFLYKDLVVPVNKTRGASVNGVYAQLGIKLGTINFTTSNMVTSEVGGNLHMTGGITYAFDGSSLVEQGFHLYPDYVECVWNALGGAMAAKPDGATNTNAYYYTALYEWADNNGNIFRSAPSIPFGVTTTGAGTTGSVVVNVPCMRMTAKTLNAIKIVIYRWSVAQQTFYQVTSISAPTFNDPFTDSIAFTDTLADASIVGNSILYTTGGVVEDIGAPASCAATLFKTRLFLVDAEDRNLVWFSKPVIENTPVEFSDLLTRYLAPTISAQGNTGPITALSAMDDKMIVFKKNALYYMTGNGPDLTGLNDDFSEFVFISSTVGTTNPKSIVFTPDGIIFQSDKGIWILTRDLNTVYIGAAVEAYNSYTVTSALTIPSTNQVRFTMSSGDVLVYDYFFKQWFTYTATAIQSSCLFQNLQTTIDSFGAVLQELSGSYLDGSRPVTMKIKTGWINIAGLQGFQRAYFLTLLGSYLSPHKLIVSIAYDYNDSFTQSTVINPDNYTPNYGGDSLYGGTSPFGGPGTLEQWRVFLQTQKCQAIQVTIEEVYDPSYGVAAGAGFTLSGMNLIVGVKGVYPRIKAANSVG